MLLEIHAFQLMLKQVIYCVSLQWMLYMTDYKLNNLLDH